MNGGKYARQIPPRRPGVVDPEILPGKPFPQPGMRSLSRVQPCGSQFERFLDTCLSAATCLWAIPCRFSPPLSAPSDSPATWPLLRCAPVGRLGSPDRVLAKILRWGVSTNSLPIELRVLPPCTGPLTSVRAIVVLVARPRGRCFAAPPMGATALPAGSSLKILRVGGLEKFVADRAESFTPVYGSSGFRTGHRCF